MKTQIGWCLYGAFEQSLVLPLRVAAAVHLGVAFYVLVGGSMQAHFRNVEHLAQ